MLLSNMIITFPAEIVVIYPVCIRRSQTDIPTNLTFIKLLVHSQNTVMKSYKFYSVNQYTNKNVAETCRAIAF